IGLGFTASDTANSPFAEYNIESLPKYFDAYATSGVLASNQVKGELKSLHDGFTYILLENENIYGNITDAFTDKMQSLALVNCLNISGDLTSGAKNLVLLNLTASSITGISGTISRSKFPNLKSIQVQNNNNYVSNIGYNIEEFKDATKVYATRLPNVTGNVDLLTNAANIVLEHTNCTIYNLSQLPPNLTELSFNSGSIRKNVIYPTSRNFPSSMSRIGLVNCELSSADIDRLLNDLAQVTTWIGFRSVNLTGTRTSASDVAVQTIISRGASVTINA
ncbi:hypothetical protein D0T53_13495, partial [Dysgonomonas sp. 216]|uniref:hypothetical protein n=1 Tax=Dysgonomonas sp. 216 TaxID=2302934 RepID=UPI0013D398BE